MNYLDDWLKDKYKWKRYDFRKVDKLAERRFGGDLGEAEAKSLTADIFLELNRLFPLPDMDRYLSPRDTEINRAIQEQISGFFINEYPKYDKEKSRFSKYFQFIVEKRIIDDFRKSTGYKRLRIENEGEMAEDEGQSRLVSLSTPIDGENGEGEVLQDILPSKEMPVEERAVGLGAFDETAAKLIALIIDIRSHIRSNSKGDIYYPLFFTNSMSYQIRGETSEENERLAAMERELFKAMRVPYLDFSLTSEPRTVSELSRSKLKPYGELVEGKGDRLPPDPQPADVLIEYLNRIEGMGRISGAAFSQQLSNYYDLLTKKLRISAQA